MGLESIPKQFHLTTNQHVSEGRGPAEKPLAPVSVYDFSPRQKRDATSGQPRRHFGPATDPPTVQFMMHAGRFRTPILQTSVLNFQSVSINLQVFLTAPVRSDQQHH